MPEVIEIIVYRLDELSEAARDRARAWYREAGFSDDWFDAVYADFETVADLLGIRLDTHQVRLWGGGLRKAPCIWFSGFWSQGDGACWEGIYSYRHGAVRDIRAHAPQDRELHRIADTLQEIQRRNFYRLRAEVSHRGQYHYEFSMAVTVTRDSPTGQDTTPDAPSTVTHALRDLARWLYGQLQAEYDYLASDDAVDETIAANDYTFTDGGRRFG